jgi:hypothetical protein
VKTRKKYIHRGEVLRAAVSKSDLTIEQAANKAGYKRSSYYHHIEDPDLPFNILEKYGKAIKYDFTEDFPEMNKYLFEDPAETYTTLTFEEAIRQRDQWREKYYQLLEKYQRLIEEKWNL